MLHANGTQAHTQAYALDEAEGTRPQSRRGRGMGLRNGVTMGGIEPQIGDDETVYQSVPRQKHHAQDTPDDMPLHHTVPPKIDEVTGMRPPSRRGPPGTRAAMALPSRPLSRPATAGTRATAPSPSLAYTGASADLGDALHHTSSDAGRELFSDCTTPDAPDEHDTHDEHHTHAPSPPRLQQSDALTNGHGRHEWGALNGNGAVGGFGAEWKNRNGSHEWAGRGPAVDSLSTRARGSPNREAHGGSLQEIPQWTPSRPSTTSQRLQIDDDDEQGDAQEEEGEGERSGDDDEDAMARTVHHLMAHARESLGLSSTVWPALDELCCIEREVSLNDDI